MVETGAVLWGAHVGTGAVWVWRSEMAEKAKAHHGEQVGELEAAYQAVVRRVGAANEQLAAEYDAATQQWSEDVVGHRWWCATPVRTWPPTTLTSWRWKSGRRTRWVLRCQLGVV
jgi:hypothetical protein